MRTGCRAGLLLLHGALGTLRASGQGQVLIRFPPVNVITTAAIQTHLNLSSLCFLLKTPKEKGDCSSVRFGAPARRLCQGGRPVGLCSAQGFPGVLPWWGPLWGSLGSSRLLSSLPTHLPCPQLTDTHWMATDLLGLASDPPAVPSMRPPRGFQFPFLPYFTSRSPPSFQAGRSVLFRGGVVILLAFWSVHV